MVKLVLPVFWMLLLIYKANSQCSPPFSSPEDVKCPLPGNFAISLKPKGGKATKALMGCKGPLKMKSAQQLIIKAKQKFRVLNWQMQVRLVSNVLVTWSNGLKSNNVVAKPCSKKWQTVSAIQIPLVPVSKATFEFNFSPKCFKKKILVKDLIIKTCLK